ncbi:MAG: 16S rRNA (guanine(527)-N(7))-methyltransferase RsmG [Bacteroidia bacterium]|nr:16S rRNA (guanine(527)-N(7))-methyltransferase RsmG [Bacteroidia bacterium]
MSFARSSFTELPAVLLSQLNPFQLEQLKRYAELLKEANALVNLISRKDIQHVWEHHILPSLLFLGWWRFPRGEVVLDIGTGGGLPGIPLAVAHPDTFFLLIDGTRKKVEVVQKIVRELGLSERVEVRWKRAEELNEKFRFIVGRAVAPLPRFLSWAVRTYLSGGVVYYYTGSDYGSLPQGWQGNFYAFADLVPDDSYLTGKGILRLTR